VVHGRHTAAGKGPDGHLVRASHVVWFWSRCNHLAVINESALLLALDLTGTFAFALNGALTAVRVTRLDIVGVVTLGMITALGGGIIRDVLIDSLPPATFSDWRYLAVAAAGGLVAFAFGWRLQRRRLVAAITALDAAGLSLFAVTGASKALDFGLGAGQAVILGAVTGVGGGTIRDVLIQQIPSVLSSGLYAIPALIGAAITVATSRAGVYGAAAALGATAACSSSGFSAFTTASTHRCRPNGPRIPHRNRTTAIPAANTDLPRRDGARAIIMTPVPVPTIGWIESVEKIGDA
jgi:uncharacterized membrane protein YeiH